METGSETVVVESAKKHKTVRKPPTKGVTNEQFVRFWMESTSAKEVLEKTKMSINTIRNRAGVLRKKGVRLKNFIRGIRASFIDVEYLNAIIDNYTAAENTNHNETK